jgi:NAD(P)-dependent dehydrogenase (short-subunit alcohol dehydrogenase family)
VIDKGCSKPLSVTSIALPNASCRVVKTFEGKTVLVTGAGMGIGRSIALAFASQGAKVAICDVSDVAASETAALAAQRGGVAEAFPADVREAGDVERAVATVVDRFGGLHILVNNAGVSQKRLLLTEIDEDEFNRVMDVNLRGVWLCMKYSIPAMLRSGGGSIVNISSAMGLVAQQRVSIYAASKHAVVGITKAAAIEYGQRGIRVNAICPGRHDTPMVEGWRDRSLSGDEWNAQIRQRHPATGRSGRPEEIASAVLFLCSDGASNIHGVALPVDGGWVAQ